MNSLTPRAAVIVLLVDPFNAAAQHAVRDLSDEAIALLADLVCDENPDIDAAHFANG